MIFLRHITHFINKSPSRRQCVEGLVGFLLLVLTITGCGTTKWSDTSRTATEQLLLTNAMDRAVGQFNFSALYNKTVLIDSKAIDTATDSKYLISAVRQHLLACGAKVVDKEEDADYCVELRAGAVGTDRNDLMVGVPSFTVPTGWASDYLSGTTSVPEIAIYKKTEQRAVVKVAAFVYNRKTNSPLWQSGNIQTESRVRAKWVFGAGPFSRGDICQGTELAGAQLNPTITQIIDLDAATSGPKAPAPSVTLPIFYTEHDEKEPAPEIPKPSLAPLTSIPVSETKPEGDSDKPEELLAANEKGETPAETPPAGEPAPAAATLAMVYPPTYQPQQESMAGYAMTNVAANSQTTPLQAAPVFMTPESPSVQGFAQYGAASANSISPYIYQTASVPPLYQNAPQTAQNPSGATQPTAGNNAYVPSSTALPWQSSDSVATTQLAPGFGSYLR